MSSHPAAPPYGHRKGWMPRTQEDFGDGGAYPEIPIAQYPLGMGMKKTTSNSLAVTLDASGKIKYDAIARQGHGKDKVDSFDLHEKSCLCNNDCMCACD